MATPGGVDEAIDVSRMTAEQRANLVAILNEVKRRGGQRLLDQLFPDTGPYRRDLYPKHLEFFEAGKTYRERAFIAGNRVGKTIGAGTEWTYHLTGQYPHWWNGYRFDRPIRLLVSGDTHETTRDILQLKMLGSTTDRAENFGTGLIPGRYLGEIVPRVHIKGAVEKAYVKSIWGGDSEIWFRSFVQGRAIFQGIELDGFWPDEECPQDVYEEGLIRLMTRMGLSTLTFTPLSGLTELVDQLISTPEDNEAANRHITTCGWDDVPHLTEQMKREMMARLPPHQRDARTRGIPKLGAGAIYPVDDDDVVVDDFMLPEHWPRGYALDVGWNKTAAAWCALNPDTDTLYIYAEHYRGQAEPEIHAQAIKARGSWMTGAIDPAARGRSQIDGQQLLMLYQQLGLNLVLANNAVEAGIYEVWTRLSTGRLKIFRSCTNLLAERRVYRRDETGKIVKAKDHLMDVMRYLVMTMRQVLRPLPRPTMITEAPTSTYLDAAMGF